MQPDHACASRLIGRLSLVAGALASLFITGSVQPASTGAAILVGVWLLVPYVILATALETSRSAAAEIAAVITTLLVATGGVLFLILVVFIERDPQGGIAVLLTPLYQTVATVVLLPITRSLCVRNARRAS